MLLGTSKNFFIKLRIIIRDDSTICITVRMDDNAVIISIITFCCHLLHEGYLLTTSTINLNIHMKLFCNLFHCLIIRFESITITLVSCRDCLTRLRNISICSITKGDLSGCFIYGADILCSLSFQRSYNLPLGSADINRYRTFHCRCITHIMHLVCCSVTVRRDISPVFFLNSSGILVKTHTTAINISIHPVCAACPAVHPVGLSVITDFISDFKTCHTVRLRMTIFGTHFCPVYTTVWIRCITVCRCIQVLEQVCRICCASLSHAINPDCFCADIIINPCHCFIQSKIWCDRIRCFRQSVNGFLSLFCRPDASFPVKQIRHRSTRITYRSELCFFYISIKFIFNFLFRCVP